MTLCKVGRVDLTWEKLPRAEVRDSEGKKSLDRGRFPWYLPQIGQGPTWERHTMSDGSKYAVDINAALASIELLKAQLAAEEAKANSLLLQWYREEQAEEREEYEYQRHLGKAKARAGNVIERAREAWQMRKNREIMRVVSRGSRDPKVKDAQQNESWRSKIERANILRDFLNGE